MSYLVNKEGLGRKHYGDEVVAQLYPMGKSPEPKSYRERLQTEGFLVVSSKEKDKFEVGKLALKPLVSIVMPFYNPGPHFEDSLLEILDVLDSTSIPYEVIAVCDGSTDASPDVLAKLGVSTVKDVYHLKRQGKGAALRTGLLLGRGDYLGFIDGDGDIDPSALPAFIGTLQFYQPDIVLGSKRHPMSKVVYPPLRRMYSAAYQLMIRALFGLSVKDTQTGIKLCRREVIERALPLMVEKRFAFDLELFVVARKLGYTEFFEAPIVIRERFSSTINIRSVFYTLLDTLAIFYRERVLRFYDRKI